MTDIALWAFFWGAVMFGLAAPLLPVWAMWRAGLASGLCAIALRQLSGPVHWSDQGFGHATGIFVTFFFFAALIATIALRQAWEVRRGTLARARLTGPGWVWVECGLRDLVGFVLGLWAFLALAHGLSGTGLGPGIDRSLGFAGLGLGVGFTLLALRRRRYWPIIPAAALGTLGVLALWGAGQSGRILAQAEALAGPNPWCLAAPPGHSPITGPSALGFFGMSKAQSLSDRHLVLIIEDGDLQQQYWSIRRQRFIPDGTATGALCHPSAVPELRFSQARNLLYGDLRMQIVGEDIRIEFDMVNTDRLTLVADLGGGQDSASMRFGSTLNVPEDALPLTPLPDPETLDRDALQSGALRLTFAAQEPDGPTRIRCLMGAFADEMCLVEAERDGRVYTFRIALSALQDWQAALDRHISRFAGLVPVAF